MITNAVAPVDNTAAAARGLASDLAGQARDSLDEVSGRFAEAWARYRAGARARSARRARTADAVAAVYRDAFAAGAFARLS